MLDKNIVLAWNEVEHDLYEENGYIFGIELDLFNDHESHYCKTIKDGKEFYHYFYGDIYDAIEQFNAFVHSA